jgi:hypothetical protein
MSYYQGVRWKRTSAATWETGSCAVRWDAGGDEKVTAYPLRIFEPAPPPLKLARSPRAPSHLRRRAKAGVQTLCFGDEASFFLAT